LKEVLIFLAKALVIYPEDVNVTEIESESGTVLELRVNPADMGRVIGKHGRIANAIRAVIKATSLKEGKRVSVDII